MQNFTTKRRVVWLAAAMALFGVGLVVGSILVLKSETSTGALFNLDESVNGSFNTDEFISDLKAFQEQSSESLLSTETNLTAGLVALVANQGSKNGLEDPTEFSDPSFMTSVVFPYLVNARPNLLPDVPASAIKLSAKADREEYFVKAKNYLVVVLGAWQKILKASPEKLEDKNAAKEYQEVLELLGALEQDLRDTEVPAVYRQIHTDLIRYTIANQTLIHDGLLGREEDPVRALITINEIDSVVEFGINLVNEFGRLDTENHL